LIVLVVCAVAPQLGSAVTIPTVLVGDTGNIPTQFGRGSVAYEYRISTTEVTNAWYAEFLNAKAASDPYDLFDGAMSFYARGGIVRSGTPGSYTYAAKPNMATMPVNFVTWYDALRFANWLSNGQGNGDTETGAYTLLGGSSTPSNSATIVRNQDAEWFLPSDAEWYKAAYYDPTLGGTGGYWLYPTQSNTAPTPATATPTGHIGNPGANVANYGSFADWNSVDGNITSVGSASTLSASYYGTFDQAGNVAEWTDSYYTRNPAYRFANGGGADSAESLLRLNTEAGYTPDSNVDFVGFRVATVPEPSTMALAVIGLASLIAHAWRRQAPKQNWSLCTLSENEDAEHWHRAVVWRHFSFLAAYRSVHARERRLIAVEVVEVDEHDRRKPIVSFVHGHP